MAEAGGVIELQRITSETHQNTSDGVEPEAVPSAQHFQLKPADGGAAAWKALIAAFVFEAILWGRQRILLPREVKLIKQAFRSPSECSSSIILLYHNLKIAQILLSLGPRLRESDIFVHRCPA
jgi:hypothetical protein